MEQFKLIILTIVNQNHSSSNILRSILDNFNFENVNTLFSSFPNKDSHRLYKLMIAIYAIYKTLYKNNKNQKNILLHPFADKMIIWMNIIEFFIKKLDKLNSYIVNAKNEEILNFFINNIDLEILQISLKLANLENFIIGKNSKFNMMFNINNMNILHNSSNININIKKK